MTGTNRVVSDRYVLTRVVASYAVAMVVGWAAGELLKLAGYTYRVETTVVGGGMRDTIYPVAGEWYGGMVGVVALLLSFGYWLYLYPRRVGERD